MQNFCNSVLIMLGIIAFTIAQNSLGVLQNPIPLRSVFSHTKYMILCSIRNIEFVIFLHYEV